VEFPVIMKPRSGTASHGAFKVLSVPELYTLWDDWFSQVDNMQVIIEPFVKGHEVDVNLVLENGKVLFREISDNEPTIGDYPESDTANPLLRTFKERAMIIPSTLSPAVQEQLYETAECVVHTLGFSTGSGVFHLEMRVDELTDEIFTIEVNGRTCGGSWPQLALCVWGVDQIACQFLAALGRPLIQATQAFNSPALYGENVAVPACRAGVLANDPLGVVRAQGRDDVFGLWSRPKGSKISYSREGNSSLMSIACFCVVSSQSAEDCRRRRLEVEALISAEFEMESNE